MDTSSSTHGEMERQTSKEVLIALDQLKKILRENSSKLDHESFLKEKSHRKTINEIASPNNNNTNNESSQRSSGEGTIRKRRGRSRNSSSTQMVRQSQMELKLQNIQQDNMENASTVPNDIELPPPPEPNLELLQFEETMQALQDSQILIPTPEMEHKKLKRRNRKSHLWKELSEPLKSSDDAEFLASFEMRQSTYEYGSYTGTFVRTNSLENLSASSPPDNNTNTIPPSSSTSSTSSKNSSSATTTPSSTSTTATTSKTTAGPAAITKSPSAPEASNGTSKGYSNSKSVSLDSSSFIAAKKPSSSPNSKAATRGAILIGPKKKKQELSLSLDSAPSLASSTDTAPSTPLSSSVDSASSLSSSSTSQTNDLSSSSSSTTTVEDPSLPAASPNTQPRNRTSAFYDDTTAARTSRASRPVSENYSRPGSSPPETHSQLGSSNGAKSSRSTLDTTAFHLVTSSSEQESKTISKTSSSTSIIKMRMKGINNKGTPETERNQRKSTTSRLSAMIGLQPTSIIKVIEGLQKFLEKLEMMLVESDRTKSESQMRLHETKVDAAKQIRIFKKWHRKVLVASYRSLAQLDILILENVISREQKKMEVLKEKIANAEQLLEEVQNMKEITPTISHKYKLITGENMKTTFHSNQEIEAHVKFIKKAQRVAKQLSGNFKRHFNTESKPMLPEQRKRALDDILDLADDIKEETVLYDKVQRKFNEFILDQRYKEGQRLEQLLSRLRSIKHHATTKIPPPEIAQFIEDFAEEVALDLGLDPSDEDLLAELTEAAVYPTIVTDLFDHYFTQPRHFNERLNKNRQYLSKLSFQKLPLELKIPETAEVLLQIRKGVERLNDMVYSMTPRYMIQAVEETLQLIYELLKKNNNRDVGADDILPIFIYTLIHSSVPDWWRYVDFTSQFLSPREANGQLGYCAVTLQAAVMFLTQIDLTDATKTTDHKKSV